MNLPQRSRGSSRVMIAKTGFGAWAIGGGGWAFGWGPQDDTASLATMRHALELGVNWIDTAAVYGLGHSEELVGRLLRERKAAERPNGLHRVWNGLGFEQPDGPAATNTQAGLDSAGMRRFAAPVACGLASISTNFIGPMMPSRL